MKQLIMIKIPESYKKKCYNIAAKVGLKISIHTRGKTAFVLILMDKDLLHCNLLTIPEEGKAFYYFFEELRRRKVEYTLDVYSHDFRETKRLRGNGIFDTKQLSIGK